MRSARQAAMANAGLASGTQVYNTRTQSVSKRVPTRKQSQHVQSSGSEARLGDILVSILDRLTSLEARVASLHPDHILQLIENSEKQSACRDRENSEHLAHVLKDVAALRATFGRADYHNYQSHSRYDTASPPRTTSPLERVSSQSCFAEWSETDVVGLDRFETDVGPDREIRPCSTSSVGTNGLGYNDESQSDMASPTPSETRDIERAVKESGIDGGSLDQSEEVQDALVEQPAEVQKSEGGATREVTIEISGIDDV